MVPSDDVKMGLETKKLVDGRTVMAGGGGGLISSDVNVYYVVSRLGKADLEKSTSHIWKIVAD